MKPWLLVIILIGVFCGYVEPIEKLKRKNIKMVGLNVTFQGNWKIVQKFFKLVEKFSLDVWKYPADQYDNALLVVKSQDEKELRKRFEKFGIAEGVAKQFDDKMKKSMVDEFDRLKKRTSNGDVPFDINDINSFEKMMKKLNQWKKQCPADLKCRIITLDTTLEGNPIKMLSIGLDEDKKRKKREILSSLLLSPPSPSAGTYEPHVPPDYTTSYVITTTPYISSTPITSTITEPEPPASKRGVWIDCLIHAREWITGTTCMLFINKLITEYKQAGLQELLEKYDWHFVPVMNPDGYKHSWSFDVRKPKEYTMRRLSRKNRARTCPRNPLFHGVDLNRNYNDGHWCVSKDKKMKDGCDFQLYCGTDAASEKETQAIQTQLTDKKRWPLCSEAILKAKDHLDLLVTMHNFANAWMFPTARTVGGLGKTCDEIKDKNTVDRLKKLTQAAKAASEKAGGQAWKSGPACEVLKRGEEFLNAPGNLMDFAFEKAEIKNPVAVELRGPFFTIGDVKDIEDAFKETWAGVVAMLNAM